MAATDLELIVLVDETGRTVGAAEKWSSHHAHTPLHLGFSCYVFDGEGSLLVTRRAAGKKVWPGVWSNTVCGHPAPAEPLIAAAERRLAYELGMTATDFEVVLPRHLYRAPPFRGVVEHELCPVLVARATGAPRPNPVEVQDHRWMGWDDFVREAGADTEDVWSWWCRNQLRELRGHPTVGAYAAGAPTVPIVRAGAVGGPPRHGRRRGGITGPSR